MELWGRVMLATRREIVAALNAMVVATGADLDDLAAVVHLDVLAVIEALQLFAAAAVAVADSKPDGELRGRIAALLAQLADIRARVASRHAA